VQLLRQAGSAVRMSWPKHVLPLSISASCLRCTSARNVTKLCRAFLNVYGEDNIRRPNTSRADVKGHRVKELIPETDEPFGRSPSPQKMRK
jgi:hypothetical protein